MRTFWPGLVVALTLSAGSQYSVARDPNVVVILADDLGYGELGVQGVNTDIPTPHIDRLAATGVRFTQAYVTAPYCAASRAGLLTGRYQTRFGFEFNPIGPRNEDPDAGLPLSETTLARLLRDQRGYATALVGKWHLGGVAKYNPLRRGFDHFFGFTHEGHYFLPPPYQDAVTWLRRLSLPNGGQGRWVSGDETLWLSTHMGHNEPDYDADNPILRNGQPVEESRYLTDALTDEAVAFMERHRERPFFLLLAYNAVHSPLQALASDWDGLDHIEDPQRRIFAAMLRRLDDGVGKVVRTLDALEVAEETLVFFLSDNGGPTRELTSSNAPLRGGKGQVYEGGLRVPFILRWPGVVDAGGVESRTVSSLDVFATAAAAAQVDAEVVQKLKLDGVDLRPFLQGTESGPPHTSLYWRLGGRRAWRQGQWKALRQSGAWELYDLDGDPSESHNLAAERPDKLDALMEAWRGTDASMASPIF